MPGSILIVDDSPDVLKLLNDLLTPQDYNLRLFSSGELALRSVQVELPDLILLDVRMPVMDGYEVCKRLKADEKSQDVPIIFISAATDVEDKVNGFELGAVDYISKPFQDAEVLARIKTHVALFRSHKQLQDSTKGIEVLVNSLRKTNIALQQACLELNAELNETKSRKDALLYQLAEANMQKSDILRENAKIIDRMMNLQEKNLRLISQYGARQFVSITNKSIIDDAEV